MQDAQASDATMSPEPSAGAVTAAAFVAPWLLLALALPAPWRWQGLALLGLLAFLLVLAAGAADRMARQRGLDPAWWGFVAVVSFGFGLAVLLAWRPGFRMPKATHLCDECDRLVEVDEPFCFGCGAA